MSSSLKEIRDRVVAANDAATPLRLRGSGTKDFYGEAFEGEILDLRSHSGIVDYEPSELVVTARCGTPIAEIEEALTARGQFLAFEPPAFQHSLRPARPGDHGAPTSPTLGGAIAAGLSGPRRMQVGAARDFVLGARLLTAEGEELRFGGSVMKNVAGFDVARLLCGSLGILGVMTEVSLKVLPRPRCERTLQLRLTQGEAIDVFNRSGSLPLPISAATWVDGVAWIRLSGAEPAVAAGLDRLGGAIVEDAVAATFWDSLRHQSHPFFSAQTVWRASVPSTAPPLAVEATTLVEWGGALRWYANGTDEVRSRAAACGGTALVWAGNATSSARFHPLSPVVAEIHRKLKQRFDPRGIFNRGRLVAGL
ncbi:MAG TPA: glycolate oxidase subunit GlcE [Steroidobacteraceae bacterium]|jgi:glycolate oxidase FAD binding subunit